jgi:hypothetical protein
MKITMKMNSPMTRTKIPALLRQLDGNYCVIKVKHSSTFTVEIKSLYWDKDRHYHYCRTVFIKLR